MKLPGIRRFRKETIMDSLLCFDGLGLFLGFFAGLVLLAAGVSAFLLLPAGPCVAGLQHHFCAGFLTADTVTVTVIGAGKAWPVAPAQNHPHNHLQNQAENAQNRAAKADPLRPFRAPATAGSVPEIPVLPVISAMRLPSTVGKRPLLSQAPEKKMACRAVHFALNREQVLALKAIAEQDRVAHVQTAIEEDLWSSDPACGQETDLAWDAIHRALTDGALGWSNGEYPLNHVILAGELLYTGGDYILSLKSPEQVRDIAKALAGVTKARLRDGYDRIDPVSYGDPLTDADFNDVWHWFTQLTGFYQRSADAGHAVLFTVSQ